MFLCRAERYPGKLFVIGISHVNKAFFDSFRRKPHLHPIPPLEGEGIILTPQWIYSHQVNVVSNHHKITRLDIRSYATRRICENNLLYSQRRKNPDRKGNLLHAVSLIIMHPALKEKNLYAVMITMNQPASMSAYRWYWKTRNILI